MPAEKSQPENRKIHFTKTNLIALPVPESGYKYYYDEDRLGLAIGVGSSGRKTFIFYRKVNRKPERKSLGVFESPRESRRPVGLSQAGMAA